MDLQDGPSFFSTTKNAARMPQINERNRLPWSALRCHRDRLSTIILAPFLAVVILCLFFATKKIFIRIKGVGLNFRMSLGGMEEVCVALKIAAKCQDRFLTPFPLPHLIPLRRKRYVGYHSTTQCHLLQ